MAIPHTRNMVRGVRAPLIAMGGPLVPESDFHYHLQSDKKFGDVVIRCASEEQANSIRRILKTIFLHVEHWTPHKHRTHHEIHVHVVRLEDLEDKR